ncbi:YecA family protein [Neisseria animalis]|uniref:YecA family protein n=1 Tax=Neisseria animalis TaxID=492 RepID=A0A5P3MSZ6_NEIAN|nr:YecA family protein [Neisseria animalis]QEY24727.1 YecA family protein [Neisseria animalis]ROW31679.1 YecA family protein [Neisseria animalis]VEE07847.1 yecA family protein [Neisseria animalis]
MTSPAFDNPAYQRLAALLDSQSETGSTMRCDEVQGFMLALSSGPDPVDATDWLSEVLGDEDLFDEAARNEVKQLVQAMIEDIRNALAAKTLPELLLYEDDAGNPDFYTWCNAYLYALDTVPTDWFEAAASEEFEDLFYPVMALGGIYDDEENGEAILQLSDKELTQLESELPHVLLDIALYWQAVRNKPQTVRREGAKTGRNDPCPCGSGKKYKACCGKN